MEIPSPSELILILLIVVVVFGAKRIPEIMGGVAQGIKSFKKALDSDDAQPAAGSAGPMQPTARIETKSAETDTAKIEPK